jgi:glycosyltransferase involved in cell wall biosynthesis
VLEVTLILTICRMRILHVIAALNPEAGGPPAIAIRLASAQAQLGHAVSIATVIPAPQASLESVPGSSQVAVRSGPDLAGASLTSMVAAADVVHIHGVWDSLLRRATRAAHRAGVPYVFTPHGMLDPWSLNQKRLKKMIALAVVYRRMLRGSIFLHALTAEEAKLLALLRLGPPMEILPNGIFPEEFADLPPAGTFRRRLPELGDRPYVLFLGRLHHKKGLDYLADAFAALAKKVPDARLVVAGPEEGEGEAFRRRIKSAGISDRVHLVGPLYGRDKLAALVDAGCFCLPSRQEGFSVAVLEALACGIPVVLSEHCNFPEVASSGAGVVVPLTTEALAGALEKMLTDPASARRMGAAGASLVRQRYTWPSIAEQSIAAYRRHGVVERPLI